MSNQGKEQQTLESAATEQITVKKVIIDSSSAILLFRCGMFPKLAEYCTPVIPETVYSELTVPGYAGADYFRELCSSGGIMIYSTSCNNVPEPSLTLHKGERDVISLYADGMGEFILIDDGKGGAFCRDNNIPYTNALLAVKVLFKRKIITEQEYFKARDWLLCNGRYSKNIALWAENADESDLSFFL